MMEQYKGAPFGELSPHVYAVADASYRLVCIWSCSLLVFFVIFTPCLFMLQVVSFLLGMI